MASSDNGNVLLPFPLFNMVKPTQTNRFFIHVLLSIGKFNNEGELFQGSCMKDFFFNAKLIPSRENVSEDDVLLLTKKLVMEQLLYVPGGTMMFDKCCLATYEALKDGLLYDSTASCDVPSFLYTSLVEQANESALQFYNDVRESLCTAVSYLPNVPDKESLVQADKEHPLEWIPTLKRLPDQSDLSVIECNIVCNRTREAIQSYMMVSLHTTKSIIICGGPGTGKTFQLCIACAYALSQGLNVVITAAMAERAISLGGRHIHYLFCIPGENITNIHHLIDKLIRGLNKNAERIQFLRMLDVMFIDEFRYLSAELLNVMDTVL